MGDDQTLTCCDCSAEFTLTAGEQEFYTNKGYPFPKRCKDCREKKKNRQNSPFAEVAKEIGHRGDKYNKRGGYKTGREENRNNY